MPDEKLISSRPVRGKTPLVRQFILTELAAHPKDIVTHTARHFAISRQAVHRHLVALMAEGLIEATGTTSNRIYALRTLVEESFVLPVPGYDEDTVWCKRVLPLLPPLPDNVKGICLYGFTEMYNNVIDHSQSPRAYVVVTATAAQVGLTVMDEGVGIFNNILRHFGERQGIADARQAMLALSKGKLTTQPERHSGQGIFFTSKAFDSFFIVSGNYQWAVGKNVDIFDETQKPSLVSARLRGDAYDSANMPGTLVLMQISLFSPRALKEVFDRFSGETAADDYAFNKTIVPISLARYAGEGLVSRSQAKRVMARVEEFERVILDFGGVDEIGQAFADEIFRVWQNQHPGVVLLVSGASPAVMGMINRARREGGRSPLTNVGEK